MCAVMVLVAAAPLALATHDVLKGAQGPRASAVTWEYTPPGLGTWSGHIVNTGLRSLVVDVYDNSNGLMDQISHQRIRFAAYDAYPSGIVDSAGVVVAANHVYSITVTPNGPQGSSCTVDDKFVLAEPPVAVITKVSQVDRTVAVSGSLSTDADGTIVSYDWTFGDGSSASGPTATHTYALDGTYMIILTVTDNVGLTDSAQLQVDVKGVPDTLPVASFTATPNGLIVNVDASASSDDKGIVSYTWSWGDGTTTTEADPLASHTYGIPTVASASAAATGKGRAPGPPHPVYGFTFGPDGVTPMTDCAMTFTVVRTGEVITYTEEAGANAYVIDLSMFQDGYVIGDILHVTATKGLYSGFTDAPVSAGDVDQVDVTLEIAHGSALMTITLTVTDTIGQTASTSRQVTISW